MSDLAELLGNDGDDPFAGLSGAPCNELPRRSGDTAVEPADRQANRYAAIHTRDILLTRSSLLDEGTPRADLVVEYVNENELTDLNTSDEDDDDDIHGGRA